MDVVYNIGGMQFGFKFDDHLSEQELKSFLSKLRAAAVSQLYKNEIDDHRKNIFQQQQMIEAEHNGLTGCLANHKLKQKEFEHIGGHGEYQMSVPERTQFEKHKTAIDTCTKNMARSELEIKLLEKLISG